MHEGLTSKYDFVRGLLVQIGSNSKSMSVLAVCLLFIASLIPGQVGAQQPAEEPVEMISSGQSQRSVGGASGA